MRNEKKLSRDERIKIRRMKRFRYSARRIGRELGRSHTSILRELERNVVDENEDYLTQAADSHHQAHNRRSKASKNKMRLKSKEIRWYVDFHLRRAQWSPEIIAGKLTSLGYRISAEAIYQFINVEAHDLKQYLLIAGKCKRRRLSGKRHRTLKVPAASKRSIEILPEESKMRAAIGHFELDAIVGRRGGAALQNKVDRRSRKMFLDKVSNLEAKPYADVLIKRMQSSVPPGVLKTILEDNGTEHADFSRIDQTLNVETYFCHPYCASERGTVENRNRGPRRFLPKGTHFDDIPDDFIEWIEDYFNNMPMKILGFKTPNQVWNEELKKAA